MRQAIFLAVVAFLCGLTNASSTIASESIAITRALVLPDTSGSLDAQEYQIALSGVSSLIERLCKTSSIQELDLLPWASASDCWRTPVARIRLPIRKEVPKASPLELDEASRLFRLARDRKLQQVRQLRDREQSRLDECFQLELRHTLSHFKTVLTNCRQGKASCTAVGAVLRRCSQENLSTVAIVITDGKEECDQSRITGLPTGARTLVVVVPSCSDGGRESQEARMANLKRLAPWALILPSFRLTDSSLDWPALLVGQETVVSPGTGPVTPGGSLR